MPTTKLSQIKFRPITVFIDSTDEIANPLNDNALLFYTC